VYVGSSEYPSRRVFFHERCKGKNFDAVWFLAVPEDERLSVERHWIRVLCPCHNKVHNPRPDPASPGWGQDPNDESFRASFRITDPGLWAGLQELIGEQEYPTTITDVMVIALREHLKRKGKYHPRPRKLN
jgi:hypothetical protein